MGNSEENYLDNLLKSVMEPENGATETESAASDSAAPVPVMEPIEPAAPDAEQETVPEPLPVSSDPDVIAGPEDIPEVIVPQALPEEPAEEAEEPETAVPVDSPEWEDDDDDLSEVMELLKGDDPDLTEINDMLKLADGTETPEQDDMMELLNQMADIEGGIDDTEATESAQSEPEGGAPAQAPVQEEQPEETSAAEPSQDDDEPDHAKLSKEEKKAAKAAAKAEAKAAKKAAKAAAKAAKAEKKDQSADTEEPDTDKKQGFLTRFFHTVTDEWEPEPTEEELAREAEEKKAAKAEADAKKEEEKKAKDEAKAAQAAEKEAAKKAKADAAAQKKKEKQEAKAAKLAAKKAKEDAQKPKNQKKLSRKKIVVTIVFAGSILGIILLFEHYATIEQSLTIARRAYYEGDYKSVYIETYLYDDDSLEESDALVKERSKIILTMQRKLDSYRNNLSMDREAEALNALLTGLETYDAINAEAESYGVLAQVQEIRDEILTLLNDSYGISEEQARELLQIKDDTAYTLALRQYIE